MKAKRSYLVSELGILAWGASVQRANLYRRGINPTSQQVRDFRRDVTGFIASELLPQYKSQIAEEQHYENIETLIHFAAEKGESVVGSEGYKYGVAQKLLNLALKYHWCLGLTTEPPHCPVDRIVINKTGYRGKINWTAITARADYEKVIDDVRRLSAAKAMSIAVWELTCFSRR